MLESITIADLMTLEDHGVTLSEITSYADADTATVPPAKILAALAWLTLRATDPDATWDDAIRRPFSEILNGDQDGGEIHPEA